MTDRVAFCVAVTAGSLDIEVSVPEVEPFFFVMAYRAIAAAAPRMSLFMVFEFEWFDYT